MRLKRRKLDLGGLLYGLKPVPGVPGRGRAAAPMQVVVLRPR